MGNAVLHGDAPSWHLDCDPSSLPETAPWLEAYNWYTNREVWYCFTPLPTAAQTALWHAVFICSVAP